VTLIPTRLRPGTVVITTADARRLADSDSDRAKLRAEILRLRGDRDELARLAQTRLDSIALQVRLRREAEARSLDLLDQLHEARGEAVEGRRPELCHTLAECSGNRAMAERVTRIVAEAAVPTLDTILGEAS
jgi:hypothetical protein